MPTEKIIIDIISVATPCLVEDNKKIKKLLEKNNLEWNFFNENLVSIKEVSNDFFANCSAIERFKNFKNACENPDSKIIWCNRGGYGSADILPFLYKMPKPKNKKILIGFSDIVSIASYVQKNWGWQVICAPMLYQIANNKVSKASQQIIFDLVKGKINQLKYKIKLLKGAPKDLNSDVVGGCVSVLSGNFATKNQLNWRNKILFLEDEGEDGERLDRYFTQIAFMINETANKPKAILLGNFKMNNEFGDPKLEKINIAIERFCDKINKINIWQESEGLLGHSFEQKPLLLGAKTQIVSSGELVQKLI